MKKEDNIEVCSLHEVHKDCVDFVKKIMLSEDEFRNLADIFKVFGDTTRIKILYILLKKELCVCDIAELLGMTQSSISHQLRILKNARLVKYRRDGKTVFYSLDDEHVYSIFSAGLQHLRHK